jgi:hypothetical protein
MSSARLTLGFLRCIEKGHYPPTRGNRSASGERRRGRAWFLEPPIGSQQRGKGEQIKIVACHGLGPFQIETGGRVNCRWFRSPATTDSDSPPSQRREFLIRRIAQGQHAGKLAIELGIEAVRASGDGVSNTR